MNLSIKILERKGLPVLAAVLILLLTISNAGLGQTTFTLSKNSDFSTDDRTFSRNETLYMRVVPTGIDINNLRENQWKLESHSSHMEFKGTFLKSGNGVFTASINLSQLSMNNTYWKWEAEFEDFTNYEFKVETVLNVGGNINPGEEVEVEGVISAIGSNSLIVNGFTFLIDANTRILDSNETVITFGDLYIGMKVKVKAYQQTDGSWLAFRIEIEEHHGRKHEIEVKGVISAMGSDYLVVNGFTFLVNEQTIIEAKHHTRLNFSDLTVGQLVEVKAIYLSDGSLLAVKIKLEHEDRSGEVEFKGIIETLGIDYLVVGGVTIYVNDQTRIEGDHHQLLTFADLTLGLRVQVKAYYQPDNTLLARYIEVEEREFHHTEFKGVIDSLTANSLFVFGREIFVDASTVYQDHYDNPITFADLEVGQTVKIKAQGRSDGSWLALKIELEDMYQVQIKVEGAIQELGSDYLIVSGIRFLVNSQTQVWNDFHTLINFLDLQIGLWVKVWAERLSDGSYLANRIELEREGSQKIKMTGTIEDLATNYLVVAGVTFLVNNLTEVYDENHRTIAYSELTVGQIVKVEAVQQLDGSLLAVEIEIEYDPINGMQLSGEIQDISSGSLTVGEPVFMVDNNTIVLDANYKLINFSNLKVADAVTVWAKKQQDNFLKATQIKIQSSNLILEVTSDNSKIAPKGYVLHQNYPNPFNPETTISFDLKESGQVELKIYNIQGQEVATLLNKHLDAGHFQMKFSAFDLPSGVYIYRIKANNYVANKRMILMK